MNIIWKNFSRCQGYIKRLNFIYYNNIILYISDNTHILPIPHMNTTTQLLASPNASITSEMVRLGHDQKPNATHAFYVL
jgi:hypothetical protein